LLTNILKDRNLLRVDKAWHKQRYYYDSSHKYLSLKVTDRYIDLFEPPHLNNHPNQSLFMSIVDIWDDFIHNTKTSLFIKYRLKPWHWWLNQTIIQYIIKMSMSKLTTIYYCIHSLSMCKEELSSYKIARSMLKKKKNGSLDFHYYISKD
jgi:hypothetical protein